MGQKVRIKKNRSKVKGTLIKQTGKTNIVVLNPNKNTRVFVKKNKNIVIKKKA